MLENQNAIVATHDGAPLYVELPASVVLEITLYRARPAGRPVHRRHQAGHPRDRRPDRGPAVPRDGHAGQGRHPRRLLPGPRQLTRCAARSKARKRALDLLFEADQRGLNATTLLAERQADAGDQPPLNPYSVELVEGVVAHWAEIDELLTTYSQGWTLTRMPGVDRAILRLGAWEVL